LHSANKLEEAKILIEEFTSICNGNVRRAAVASLFKRVLLVTFLQLLEAIVPGHYNRYDFRDIAVRVLGGLAYHELSNYVVSKQ
jgi:hypothetical protein